MSIGFCTDLDVDLSLECEDTEDCVVPDCSQEAVMAMDHTMPCGCQYPVCLSHFEQVKSFHKETEEVWCNFCYLAGGISIGLYLGWHKI